MTMKIGSEFGVAPSHREACFPSVPPFSLFFPPDYIYIFFLLVCPSHLWSLAATIVVSSVDFRVCRARGNYRVTMASCLHLLSISLSYVPILLLSHRQRLNNAFFYLHPTFYSYLFVRFFFKSARWRCMYCSSRNYMARVHWPTAHSAWCIYASVFHIVW